MSTIVPLSWHRKEIQARLLLYLDCGELRKICRQFNEIAVCDRIRCQPQKEGAMAVSLLLDNHNADSCKFGLLDGAITTQPTYPVSVLPKTRDSTDWSRALYHLQAFCDAVHPNERHAIAKGIIGEIMKTWEMAEISGGLALPEPSRRFSRFASDFSILESIGRGGGCEVFASVHKIDQSAYAVKRMEFAASHVRPESIIREAQVMINLAHPNVVRYHDAWLECDLKVVPDEMAKMTTGNVPMYLNFYVQMELCSRINLRGMCGGLNLADKLNCLVGVCRGLEYIHKAGIIHRDLKPENILVGIDQRPKIVDFGISVRSGNRKQLVMVDRAMESATLMYASPEHNDLEQISPEVDIFSLGIIMAQVLVDYETRMEECKVIRMLKTERKLAPALQRLPDRIGKLILSMTSRVPSERPTSETVLRIVEEVLENVLA